MSIRDKVAVAAEQSSTALQLDRTRLRGGIRWEASRNGKPLGVCAVYPDGEAEGWTVDGSTQDTLQAFLEAAHTLGKR